MAAKHPRHIALTGPIAAHMDQCVAQGEYASASEMVRVALRLLIERNEAKARRKGEAKVVSGHPHDRT